MTAVEMTDTLDDHEEEAEAKSGDEEEPSEDGTLADN